MRILVTGATGFVGRQLCARLVGDDHEVVAVTRREGAFGDPVREVVIPDIGEVAEWPSMGDCEAVVHLAAHVHRLKVIPEDARRYREINVDATTRLVEDAAKRGVRRFVFLSTVKVHGEVSGARPIVEESPIAPKDEYARSKVEAEMVVRRSGVPGVTLRPPLVYGPGVGANFLRLMRAVARERVLPFGRVRNLRSLVYVGNLVDAIACALKSDRTSRDTFLVADGESVSTAGLVRGLAAGLGVRARLAPVPVGLLRLGGAMLGRSGAVGRLVGSLEVDDSAIRASLGWQPPFTLDQGLRRTAEWFIGEEAQ